MKEYQIKYNGGTSKLTLDDQPKAGMILKITKPPIVKYKVGQAVPDIDFEEYLIYLATNLITEAPWPKQDVNAIRNLPRDTFIDLCTILGDEFPLEGFLYPVAKLMYGKKLEIAELLSQTESTLKPSSAGSPSGS